MPPDNNQSTPTPGATQAPLAGQSLGSSSATTETSLSEAIITLRKRRLAVSLVVLLGLLYGVYHAVTQERLYEAYGRIQVRTGASNEFKLNSISGLEDDPARKMQTEVAIISSDTLMATVGREMNLANNPNFLGVHGSVPHREFSDPNVRADTVARLSANLKVALVPKTDIIRISYSSIDPKLSADIVNRVIADYIDRSYRSRFDSTVHISHFLEAQLDDLKQKVEEEQAQVIDLQKKLGTLGFDPAHNQIATSLDELSRATGAARLQRILAESRYRLLAAMDPANMAGSIDAGPQQQAGLLNLRSTLAAARAKYESMRTIQGPNNPELKAQKAEVDELQRQITAEQQRLLTQAKQSYLIAKADEDQTSSALETQKQSAYQLRDAQVDYTLRLRDFEANRTLYEGLSSKLRTATLEAGLESTEIDIVDAAVIPTAPLLKSQSSIVLTYTFLGIVGGILLAFLLESLDTGLRSVAEIENVTELPSLAIVPRAKKATPEQTAAMSTVERNLNVLTQPKSQFTEAFRSLRTALLLSSTGREPKYILFTSATPSEGKTTAAGNLAVILAQRGTRILLIDGDLRRPNIHHRFGLNGKIGLSTILSGQSRLEDSVQTVREVPNLDILSSGPVPPFPTEMLASQAMTDLLHHAGEIYSHIVIDSPPILSVTDGVVLSRLVDSVVLVVRHGKSSKHVVRRARDLLVRSNAPIAGIVLNAVDLSSPEYYGYYGYSGYSYSSLDTTGWDSKGKSTGSKSGKSRSSSSDSGRDS